MKKVLLFSALLLLVFPQTAYANIQVSTTGDSNVTVNQKTLGETTTCVNGKCTTTGGGGKTTVCINGVCHESEDGNLDINEGNTQIHIKNSNNSSSVSVKSNGSSNTSVNVDTGSGDDKKETTDEAKKVIKKIQEARRSILDKIKEFLSRLFPFF